MFTEKVQNKPINYTMRNLLLLYLLLLSASVFAEGDTLSIAFSSDELAAYPVAIEAILDGQKSFEAGETKQALASYQRALMNLVPSFTNADPSENPNEKSFYANSLLSKALEGKAKVYESLVKKRTDINALEKALSCRELIFEVDRHLAHTGKSYEPKHYDELVAQAFDLYEKTNNPSVLLRVFRSVEKCRKIRTLENLRDPSTQLIANVPAKLVTELKQQKLRLDQALRKHLSTKGTAVQAQAEEAYKAIRKNYQNALFDSKKKYPDFYRLQYDESVVTVGEIQNRIAEKEEAVIAFYDTPDQLYIFVIAQNGFRGRRITKDFPLEGWVKDLRTEIQNYGSGDKTAACNGYRELGYKLYQKIVEPLGSLPKNLVIIPDGAVAQLPFSALLSRQVSDCNFSKYPFMLRDHQISYHYGADLYARAAYLEHESYKSVVGFTSDTDLGALTKVMGGKVFNLNKNSKANFEQEGVAASLLHLAVPAQTNSKEKPLFSFQLSDENQFLEKAIYDLKLESQLVVLSDCTVGSGDTGLLDVVQGLQYAGAQSVLTALWKNDESVMTKMMTDFYTQLRNGMTKDAALRSACLSLWKGKDAELCHPLHWATYMPVGDMDAVKEKNWYLYLIGMAPLVALFYFWRKYKR